MRRTSKTTVPPNQKLSEEMGSRSIDMATGSIHTDSSDLCAAEEQKAGNPVRQVANRRMVVMRPIEKLCPRSYCNFRDSLQRVSSSEYGGLETVTPMNHGIEERLS
ncbi:hypothetical protein VTI28DRAFT_1132 [Corynascus sepedonium]